jgi:hypothetical protein
MQGAFGERAWMILRTQTEQRSEVAWWAARQALVI